MLPVVFYKTKLRVVAPGINWLKSVDGVKNAAGSKP